MGMAASQARLLTITARLHDVEEETQQKCCTAVSGPSSLEKAKVEQCGNAQNS